ncbi:MAG: biotin/lipoyl-containing protein [Bacteroidaceae bacterium]
MKQYKYKINGNEYNVVVNDPEENIAIVEVNGTSYHVEMEAKPKPVKPVVRAVQSTPRPAPSTVTPKPVSLGKNGVQSPLPGVILQLKVAVGDTVKKGQTILILEAMKMENNINATQDGKVTAINVNQGDSVLEGTVLAVIE